MRDCTHEEDETGKTGTGYLRGTHHVHVSILITSHYLYQRVPVVFEKKNKNKNAGIVGSEKQES